MNLLELESALDALEAEGARGFDAAACDCVRTLLVRAEELGGTTGERLASRAGEHLTSLADRFHAQRERVKRALEEAELRLGAQPDLEQTLVRGDVVTVARRLRRARYRSVPRTTTAPAIRAHVDAPTPQASAAVSRADITRVRRKRALVYEDSVAELVASFALARAGDVVPKDAGPYNALRIASQALDTMRELSPSYLTSQLNRLEELASLLALPDLPPKEPPAPPKTFGKQNKALPKKKPGALKS